MPQFTTVIDGVKIHFIHVRSPHEEALSLFMTHGWPGSVVELLETFGPLTDPSAHGAIPRTLPPGDAVVGRFGIADEPTELGWESGRTAHAWAELMGRLGYTRYVAHAATWLSSSPT